MGGIIRKQNEPDLGKKCEGAVSFAQARGASRMGKGRSFRTARKLHSRRDQKWHDKQYKKAPLGTALGASPVGGASHAKGIVLRKAGVEAKQPHSAIRKCVRIQLIKNGKNVTAFVPSDGCLNFTEENDEVLVLDLAAKVMLSATFLEFALRLSK